MWRERRRIFRATLRSAGTFCGSWCCAKSQQAPASGSVWNRGDGWWSIMPDSSRSVAFFQNWANGLGLSPQELRDGVAAMLDFTRRSRILLDRDRRIFSKIWQEGDREIANGYLPLFRGGPKGVKLQRDPGDAAGRVAQWLGTRPTSVSQAAQRWGVNPNDVPRFLQELWQTLTDELHLIVPAALTGFRDRPLPGTTNARQIDADLLRLRASSGIWRCQACRRAHSRPTPRLTCLAWRCTGTLALETEDPDNYDLIMLDGRFDMIRPREHSAQIPGADREELERVFKGDGDRVNTLVCTPTLELGVDIGALDSVLMRNVPPLPSNYWQRAGRAGRRHRMAAILTYARAHSHDRPYFNDPLKLLSGEIAPPSFNLRNDVMVRKHVHAIVLTGLHTLVASQLRNWQRGADRTCGGLAALFSESGSGVLVREYR